MIVNGIGYDMHRFAPGRALVLGGVEVPHEAGLDGHSDADVLTHAITDALLGAATLGDIGDHFPDTDQRFAGASSIELLRDTVALLHAQNSMAVHIDATVILERPRLAPWREAIRRSLAGALELSVEHVSVKATRGEGLGFIGREEGAAAIAVATVERA
jgi:2-C-methyl-D-erythritol 2,4-cyclodiphosphate synthase